jgi:heptosyltransferase-2
MKELVPERIENVLVRSANWVGDALLTTPAIRAIRKDFPSAQITILAKPWVAPVFYNNPHCDHIMLYDDQGRHRKWWGKVRLSNDLRRMRFDLAILMQNAFEAALLTWLAGIPNRLGYRTDGRGVLLTHSIPVDPSHKEYHQIDYYLGILKGASLGVDDRLLTLSLTDAERTRAREILRQFGMGADDVLIGINPGATYGTAKRWFPERYAALCRRIQASFGGRILIFGGPAEEGLGDQIARAIGNHCTNLCGGTNLREAMALIERCTLFVTNDSGLMHVAAAFDIPQIVIIGSTDPVRTGPSNPRSRIVEAPTPCGPCLETQCPTDHRCMKEVSVEMVYEAATTFLRLERGQEPRLRNSSAE